MSETMRKVVERMESLSEEDQELTAQRWMEELDEDSRWDASFAASQGWLEKMANQVREERKAGTTRPIEELCD